MVVEVAGFEFVGNRICEDHFAIVAADELEFALREVRRGVIAVTDWAATVKE